MGGRSGYDRFIKPLAHFSISVLWEAISGCLCCTCWRKENVINKLWRFPNNFLAAATGITGLISRVLTQFGPPYLGKMYFNSVKLKLLSVSQNSCVLLFCSHMACEEERAEIAVTLVENGANLYIQNKVSQDFETRISDVNDHKCVVFLRWFLSIAHCASLLCTIFMSSVCANERVHIHNKRIFSQAISQ